MSDRVLDKTAEVFKFLSDPTRLAILLILNESELSVSELSASLKVEQSALSHALRLLRLNKYVKCRKEGRSRFYSIRTQEIKEFINSVIIQAQNGAAPS